MQFKTVLKQMLQHSIKTAAIICVASSALAGPVNINKADATTLAKELTGVGEKRAAAIVAYRDENGAFTGVDDLEKVKGIGSIVMNANADNILLK